MKREKALTIIANQLDFINGKFEGFRFDFSKEELSNAEVIFTTLEHAGLIKDDEKKLNLCYSCITSNGLDK